MATRAKKILQMVTEQKETTDPRPSCSLSSTAINDADLTDTNLDGSAHKEIEDSLKNHASLGSSALCNVIENYSPMTLLPNIPESINLPINIERNLQIIENQDTLNFIIQDNGILSLVGSETDYLQNDVHDLPDEPVLISTKADTENVTKNVIRDEQVDDNISATSGSDYLPDGDENVDSDYSDSDQVENETYMENNNTSVNANHGDMNEGRKRKHKADTSDWKKNKNQKLRMEGKQYLGYTKPKNQVMKQNKMREVRSLKPGCTSSVCQKSKKRMCSKFTEDDRKAIFNKFWSDLNWDQRKVYVSSHVSRIATKRRTTTADGSRRSETLKYTLTLNNNIHYPVCRKMFLNTLALGSFTVQSWTKRGNHGMHAHKERENLGRTKKNNPHAEDIRYLKDFINQIPKLPSHYNRANSSKLYLEPIFKSLKQLYDLYVENCQKDGKKSLSNKTFYTQFNDSNLALYRPKKDQCDTCVSYTVGNISDERYSDHIKRKNRARLEKDEDKKFADEKKCILLTMDLQAVKVCPNIQASSVFFKTKLCCHNFTIYDVISHHSTCYWFTECDCDLVASAFASCIIDYLERHCTAKKLPIVIFSDGCTYQNRNNVLANALLNYTVQNKITVIQKFLERGHTQMECDSVHSCIERKLKNRNIHLPSDYISATKEARSKPFPYEVIKLGFDFFKDYSKSCFLRYNSIRPGRKPNEPTVTDIRALRYNLEGSIDFKLHFDDDWNELPSRPKKIFTEVPNYPALNNSKIPINKSKFKHLQELKSVIPDDCHHFYDSLPCKND